jgi:hypothetical protein
MRVIVPGFALVLMSAAVLAAPATGSGTGIRGRVTSSPTCPVERMPPDPGCAPRGFAARVTVRRRSDNHVVARIGTKDDGRWSLRLKAGRYSVAARPASGASLPRCPSAMKATVKAGAYTRVTIDCDSGIR